MNSTIEVILENPILEGLVRATLVLALACIADALLRSKNPRWRILLSRSAVLLLLALPCIALLAPAWELAVLPRAGVEASIAEKKEANAATSEPTLTEAIAPMANYAVPTPQVGESPSGTMPLSHALLAFCALTSVALILGSTLRYIFTLRRARRGASAPQSVSNLSGRIARDLGLSFEPEVFLDASARAPYVFGCFRPVMVLPAHMASDTYAADLPSILSHELAHIGARDTLWIPLVHLFKQALWFHPLAWRLQHAHAEACEAVCDAQAAQYVGGAEKYSSCLARVALEVAGSRRREAMAVPMIRRSQVTRRLRVLSRGVGANSLTRGRFWMAILLASAVAFPLVSMKIVRAQDPSNEAGTGPDEPFEIITVVTLDPSTDSDQEQVRHVNKATALAQDPSTEPGGGVVGRAAILLTQATPDAADEAPESTEGHVGRIENILESPVGIVFEDIHLKDVLDFVTETYEFNIIFDNRVVAPPDWEGVPGEGNTYVTDGRISYINLKNVTLREAIKAMLRPLSLSYSVQRSFVWISSPEHIKHETFEVLETRFYELSEEEFLILFPAMQKEVRRSRDLEKPFHIEPHQMPNQLQEEMPEIREPVTGRALSFLRYNRLTGVLVIHHTPSAQQKFKELLRSLFRVPLASGTVSKEKLETRTYTVQEGALQELLLLKGVFESPVAIPVEESMGFADQLVVFIQPSEAEAYVFPDIKVPQASEPISWQRFDSTNNRLIIHHTPSALDEFEAFFRREGWAIERASESRADTLQRLEPEAALVEEEVIISDDGPLRKGTINFASDYSDGGQITVYSNGKMLGVLNDFLKAGQEAECGETHTGLSLAAEYWPHRYPYVAVAEDGTEWKGHFEIQSGGCETLVLSVE